MDKAYYKTLSGKAEQLEYMDVVRKDRKAEWDKVNTEKVYKYRRQTTLRRCEQRCSLPTKGTVDKYKFTKEELIPIFNALWSKWCPLEFDVTDKEDSSTDDNE